MLAKDTKNYHVWSYRQWLVQHFQLWPDTADTTATAAKASTELIFTESVLEEDVFNNSAWNHRFFVLFGRDKVEPSRQFNAADVPDAVWDREIQFVKDRIALEPQNISSWNYLQGVQQRRGRDLSELEEFTRQYADPENESGIRSSHALDLLAEIRAASNTSSAKRALELLVDKFDPIRANYWKWRIAMLPSV